MEHITEATNEVLIETMRRAVWRTGHYNFVQGQLAEAELRERGVKVWRIDWHQSTDSILGDTRLSFP
jgi:hypothetical protein